MTGGRGPFVLGVDGGATKTLALVGGPDGRIRGAGRAGSSDIHRASDPSQALERIVGAVDQATRAAGVPAARLTGAVFSLCGADWPEDVELYRSGLRGRLGLAEPPVVVNDALGPLLAETPDGRGVSIVVGTGLAIGARGPGGPAGTSWHSGFWVEPSGASELGRDGLFALLRAELGAGPATAIRPRALAAFGVGSVEELLHLITRVGGLGELGLTRLGPVVLDAGHAGDPVAAAIVRVHAHRIAAYAAAAARLVGLVGVAGGESGEVSRGRPAFPVLLSGGVLRHECRDLVDGIRAGLRDAGLDGAELVRSRLEPVAAALLVAYRTAGLDVDVARLVASAPDAGFFATM